MLFIRFVDRFFCNNRRMHFINSIRPDPKNPFSFWKQKYLSLYYIIRVSQSLQCQFLSLLSWLFSTFLIFVSIEFFQGHFSSHFDVRVVIISTIDSLEFDLVTPRDTLFHSPTEYGDAQLWIFPFSVVFIIRVTILDIRKQALSDFSNWRSTALQ